MKQAYRITGFATPFPALAAVTAPAQEFMTREAVYRPPSGRRLRAPLRRWLGVLRQAVEQRRARQALARLDDRVLRDIGLRRADLGPALEAPFLGLGEPLAREPGAGRGPTRRDPRVGLWHL